MRRSVALVIALLLVSTMVTVVYAGQTMTVTTTVPSATYVLKIPQTCAVPFGQENTNIGTVTVTDSKHFGTDKNLEVKVTYDSFKCEGTNATIPYSLVKMGNMGGNSVTYSPDSLPSGDALLFVGTGNGSVNENFFVLSAANTNCYLELVVTKADWNKALSGDYTSTITFEAEVVSSAASQ